MVCYSNDNVCGSEENGCFRIAYFQTIGGRTEQQDCIGYCLDSDKVFAVLCDGMGGYRGGRLASNSAVINILQKYQENVSLDNPSDFMISVLERCDSEILNMKDSMGQLLGAGSTAILVYIKDNKLYFASVGDSRLYIIKDRQIRQLSIDMNYKYELDEKLSAGEISQNEYDSEIKHGEELISYLGMGGLDLIHVVEEGIELQKNDKIIAVSDGIYKLLDDNVLKDVLLNFSNLEQALSTINMDVAKQARRKEINRDNASMIVISVL